MSHNYDFFENLSLLLNAHDNKSINVEIVDKIRSVLNEEEADALDSMLNAVRLPSTDDSDAVSDVSVDDVREVFKTLVWEQSDKWTDEMHNVPVSMMAYMSYVELRNFKLLIGEIKNIIDLRDLKI